MPKDDALLTSAQAGSLLNRSARTVTRMAEAGQLPFAQKLPGPNGAYLFREGAVREYLDAQPGEGIVATTAGAA